VLVFGIALGIAAAFYAVGDKPLLGGIPRPAPPPAPCLISGPAGPQVLSRVDSLENCGVQLEAIYLEDGRPVTGGYNGLRLFVDAQGIDAAQLHGPRQKLIADWLRRRIDDELHSLMRARDGQSGLQISVVRPRTQAGSR
jgi:hypothetical protein